MMINSCRGRSPWPLSARGKHYAVKRIDPRISATTLAVDRVNLFDLPGPTCRTRPAA